MTRPGILVVEDDPIIALDMAAMVENCGGRALGPAGTVDRALRLIEEADPEAGVLDINLGRERIWPVARALADRSIPFVLATGYSRIEIDPAFQDTPLLSKPVMPGELERALVRIGVLDKARRA